MDPSLRAKRPTTDRRLLVCGLDSGGESRGFRPRFFFAMSDQAKKESKTETDAETATAAEVGKKRPGLRGRLKMREKGRRRISGRTPGAAIKRAEERDKRFAGPKRGISTLSGAASRYGGVRALALGLSLGGRGVKRRCCKMRIVAIKRGESCAWGRSFFGSEAERPRCGLPCGSSGPAHFAKFRRSGGIAAGGCLPLSPSTSVAAKKQ